MLLFFFACRRRRWSTLPRRLPVAPLSVWFSSLSHCSVCCLHGRALRPCGAPGAGVPAGLVACRRAAAWARRATAPRVAWLAVDAVVICALSAGAAGGRDRGWSVWRWGSPGDGVCGGQWRPQWWRRQGCGARTSPESTACFCCGSFVVVTSESSMYLTYHEQLFTIIGVLTVLVFFSYPFVNRFLCLNFLRRIAYTTEKPLSVPHDARPHPDRFACHCTRRCSSPLCGPDSA